MKTTRKTNTSLFEKCFKKIGCKRRYDVIRELLVLWENGDIEITNFDCLIDGQYKYTDIFLDIIKMNTFVLKLSKKLDTELKDWQALDLLMYNYLKN